MKSTSRPRYSRPRRTPQRPPRRPPQRRPRPRKQPPIIPATSTGGSPPTSFELLQETVLALKEEPRGISLPEIRRQMLKKYKGRFDKASNDLLTTTLKRLAKRGIVIYKQGYKYRFNAPEVTKHEQNRDDTDSENKTDSGVNTNSYVSAATTSGGSATTAHTEGTNGSRSLDSRTSAASESDTGTRSTGSRSSKSSKTSKSSKSCTKSTRDSKSTKNTQSTKSTKSIRSTKRKEEQDKPQNQEKAPQDDAQSPEKVEEEEAKSSATRDFSSSVAATGYTTSKGSQESSKRRRR